MGRESVLALAKRFEQGTRLEAGPSPRADLSGVLGLQVEQLLHQLRAQTEVIAAALIYILEPTASDIVESYWHDPNAGAA